MGTTRPYPAGDPGPERSLPPASPVPPTATEPEPSRQTRSLRLAGTPGVVSRAREFAREALRDWGWLPSASEMQRAAAEDVLLVVSELVTNACLHADGPEEIRVGRSGKLLRVEVVDSGEGAPALATTRRAGSPGGHGMFIVQRLCLDWGVTENPEIPGKTVWAELSGPSAGD
ncbi:ATP-binding protein [Streptomyces sp. NBC_01803]|uniref:ATP-binding protein n=1 Tax=Streptomyces sp. NBC_01803 TaxID=2975946 RepID=UPI002DD8CEBC|nr:ATP-binding protein [Streptomyces sp. NBC_01803]WSA44506.1 ATP-binding protein [Streptomyces sp. NBC_01803]